MKSSSLVSLVTLAAVLSAPASLWSDSDRGGSRRGNEASTQVSRSENGDQSPQLTINVAFSGQSGRTVTDQWGTFYHVWGWSFFENKVYLPAYWGVFPLYFFGDRVGVTVTVANQSPTRKAKLLLKSDSYCLNTDGSNGAQLMQPGDFETTLAAGETRTIDASFVVDYVADADSGLDRLLIQAYRAPADDDGEHTIGGEININPNNSTDNEFRLVLPNGSVITRDNLAPYSGSAQSARIKPKGNGNQNTLLVDGEPYELSNANTYVITGSPMTVNLYNAASDGTATGQWWIGIDAANATITCDIDGQGSSQFQEAELIMTKEAIFCPPEFEGDLWQAAVGDPAP